MCPAPTLRKEKHGLTRRPTLANARTPPIHPAPHPAPEL
jgi:hypothetical protein